jgi:hypothetical protein
LVLVNLLHRVFLVTYSPIGGQKQTEFSVELGTKQIVEGYNA